MALPYHKLSATQKSLGRNLSNACVHRWHRYTRAMRDIECTSDKHEIGVIKHEQTAWTVRIYDAIFDQSKARDKSTSSAYQRLFGEGMDVYTVEDVLAGICTLWHVFLDGAEQGWIRPSEYVSRQMEEYNARLPAPHWSERLDHICERLKHDKWICEGLIEDKISFPIALVFAPMDMIAVSDEYKGSHDNLQRQLTSEEAEEEAERRTQAQSANAYNTEVDCLDGKTSEKMPVAAPARYGNRTMVACNISSPLRAWARSGIPQALKQSTSRKGKEISGVPIQSPAWEADSAMLGADQADWAQVGSASAQSEPVAEQIQPSGVLGRDVDYSANIPGTFGHPILEESPKAKAGPADVDPKDASDDYADEYVMDCNETSDSRTKTESAKPVSYLKMYDIPEDWNPGEEMGLPADFDFEVDLGDLANVGQGSNEQRQESQDREDRSETLGDTEKKG